MTKFITKVTVTGADNHTSPADLMKIQYRFPFVEFGILLSEKYSMHEGGGRFPGRQWLGELAGCDLNLNLSGHLCGQWVRDLLTGSWPDLSLVHWALPIIFQRFQINTHGEPHRVGLHRVDDWLTSVAFNKQSVIFQLDGRNNELLGQCLARGHANVSGLFDLSHGAGVLPAEWPVIAENVSVGYAGGLSPENVARQIERIHTACGGRPVWIDAETHLRSADDRFDLGKVEAFLEAASPWVI